MSADDVENWLTTGERDLLTILAAAVGYLAIGRHVVVVLPEDGNAYVAGEYATREVAHRLRTRLENRGDGAGYVARRHRGGLTVDLSREVILGTLPPYSGDRHGK